MTSIKTWPEQERPREKLLQYGAAALSNAELLSIFLRTGVKGKTSVDLARDLIAIFGDLHTLFNANIREFCQAKGLGVSKFVQLQAVLEMSKRYLFENIQKKETLNGVEDTKQYLLAMLSGREQEVFACLFLNTRFQVTGYKELFYGSVNYAKVYPGEVVKAALNNNAVAVIVAHNHPSGNSKPSSSDIELTKILKSALKLVDITILDHIVVAKGETHSFVELGLL